MSFLSKEAREIIPYTPGEQPQDKEYIKLNTNECPYPPSPKVFKAFKDFNAGELALYPDPNSTKLKNAAAKIFNLNPDRIFAGGGSDEILAYCFMAFCGRGEKVYFPDVTYGFYGVYANLFKTAPVTIPLDENYEVNVSDYAKSNGPIFLANPNAPTGIKLPKIKIIQLLDQNKNRLLILDEAYIDFSGDSCVELINDYENLLTVQTFSKSRALAGMRLALAFGAPDLIAGLETVKFSFNPFNLDRFSTEIAVAALSDFDWLRENVKKINATRERTKDALENLGFRVLPSEANFLFAAHKKIGGKDLYTKLKDAGILVRFFNAPRTRDFIRISIGTDEDAGAFIGAVKKILCELTN
jgi:histidinol-phosphate aminotransferase